MPQAERRFPIGLNPDPDGSSAWSCGSGPLAHAERQMMTDQVLRGIAGMQACHSHLRWRASVLGCGSALPLFGRRARRPQAPEPGRGSRASPVCSSATTCRFPGDPRRTRNQRLAAQARSLGVGLISAPFLPHFCLNQLMPTRKIQFPVLFGSLWFSGARWPGAPFAPPRCSSPGVTRGKKIEIW